HLHVRSGVAEGHRAAVRGDGMAAGDVDVAVVDEAAALTGTAEAERLELTDDLERERVVELEHVDIGSLPVGHRKSPVSTAFSDQAIGVHVRPAGQIPFWWE